MAAAPLIGVSTSITVGTQPGARVRQLGLPLRRAAGGRRAGGAAAPALAPRARALALRLDGLLLTGGGDMDPALFGEAPHPTLYDVAPPRDRSRPRRLGMAIDRGLPILAVCRGIQVLNVALGGSLHQDVLSDPGTPLIHSQKEPRDQPSHAVKIAPDSRLASVMGTDAADVNSMHHQAVKALGRGLRAVAWAPDQIVEAVELEDPVALRPRRAVASRGARAPLRGRRAGSSPPRRRRAPALRSGTAAPFPPALARCSAASRALRRRL